MVVSYHSNPLEIDMLKEDFELVTKHLKKLRGSDAEVLRRAVRRIETKLDKIQVCGDCGGAGDCNECSGAGRCPSCDGQGEWFD